MFYAFLYRKRFASISNDGVSRSPNNNPTKMALELINLKRVIYNETKSSYESKRRLFINLLGVG